MSLSFTPSIILALVFLLVFILFLLGTVSIFTYRYFISGVTTAASVQVQQECNVDLEAASKARHDVSAAPLSSTSFWSNITFWRPRPAEPELPWPILAVLPSLRPKGPLYRRVLKLLMFWRKEEVKHEPFTVADVLKAIEEVNNRAAARDAPTEATDIDHAERATRTNEALKGWWRRCFAFSMFNRTSPEPQVPSIVIHPCDGTPPFSYCDAFTPLAAPPSPSPPQARFTVHYASSTPPSPSATSSPTISEPDSPGPVTPALESSTYFSELPYIHTRDCLDVPMPSSTAPREDGHEPKEDVPTLSNVTGKHFVLAAPRKRNSLAAARNEEVANKAQEDLAALRREFSGLFTTQSMVDFREQLPAADSDIFEDASEEMSTHSSDSSVVDLVSILNSITSSSSTSSEQLATIPTNSAAHSRTIELSNRYFLRLMMHSEMMDAAASAAAGASGEDEDCDEGDNASVASGDTDFYECSAESNFGLGFDIEELYGRREAIECSA